MEVMKIGGIRANYVIEYRKRNIEKENIFQSVFVSTGPLIGLDEYKTVTVDPFLGLGVANMYEEYVNVYSFQLGINKRVNNKIVGLYLRYIKDINSEASNLYMGCTFSKSTYNIK
jgi:hypothetical protein